MYSVNHKQLQNILKRVYDKKLPLYLWGAVGIGKSTAVNDYCKSNNLEFVDVRLSTLESVDIRGLPSVDGDSVKWLPPSFLPKEGKGILFLDELNLALPSILASAYQLILDRKVGEYVLPDGWVVVGAGNRLSDKANVFDIPAPSANRFLHVELTPPSVDDWGEWAMQEGVHIDTKIVAFLMQNVSALHRFSPKNEDKAFPTHRTWSFCSRMIEGVEDLDEIRNYSALAVGEATASEFYAFTKLVKDWNVDEVLANPKMVKNIKDTSQKYALIPAIVERFAKDRKIFDKVVAVGIEFEPEFGVMMFRMCKMKDSKFFMDEMSKPKHSKEFFNNFAKYMV